MRWLWVDGPANGALMAALDLPAGDTPALALLAPRRGRAAALRARFAADTIGARAQSLARDPLVHACSPSHPQHIPASARLAQSSTWRACCVEAWQPWRSAQSCLWWRLRHRPRTTRARILRLRRKRSWT